MRRVLVLLSLVIVPTILAAWALTHRTAQPATAAHAAPATSASRPVPRDNWQSLRAITANIRLSQPSDNDNQWPNRREFVVKTFLKYEPDIIACQEVSPAQGAYLNKELSRWYAYFPRAGVGTTSRPAGGGELLGMLSDSLAALNTIYYRSDRFDILDGESGLIIPEAPQAAATENTFFTLAVLQEKAGSAGGATAPRRVIVVDTHFRHGQPFAQRCAGRLRLRIGGWLAKFPGAGVIVMGDMNHDRATGSYAILQRGTPATRPQSAELADAGPPLVDAFDYPQKPAGIRWGTYHRFTGTSNADTPTDLIFHSPEFTAAKPGAQLIRDQAPGGKWPSDHFFVMTALEWNPGPAK